ncbi:heme o synthase [Saliterribacillus persicus]|uniref:Protoheme IX farnesyltransferase n=1 Tax=Saliterribacillus persicus TaxID=930114 RepID=A0A368YG81_9BACI|nr:heme o synthase [Saliterribacillus persicus]RCW77194.1 protoheme IX farnesyltransferase [Saliterribacillus persicus]
MVLRHLIELQRLFKRFVLIANFLPVFVGFILAIAYYNVSFYTVRQDFLLVTVGSILLIAGALALNNWLEADVDKLMERTKKRPTVTGTFSLRTVLLIGIIFSAIGQGLLFLINLEVALYGFTGWFMYVVIYTMMTKRRFTWNTHIGSISGAVTPLMGWAVIDSAIAPIPISLFLIMFLWQMPHTYAIAIRKFDDYNRAGLKMLPVVKGFQTTICRTVMYMLALFFVPLLIDEISMPLFIIMTIINLAWLMIGLAGFRMQDTVKWATILFVSSLIYLMLTFLLYVIFI